MARTDHDTWDLASSVGATATLVAAARAAATRADNPVINDPFAEPLVRAVGVDFFTRMATGELNPEDLGTEAGGPGGVGLNRFADGMAARTRFFDDFFAGAAAAGVRQAVILASGLDARAYRLQWPAGMVVFEIDQPEVIEFKTTTMADLGAEPTADRRTVAIDLRNDWPAALSEAGFDPNKPTAWIAEGLFGYLPPEAQDRLLDQITELSAPGSRVAAEGVPSHAAVDDEEVRQRMEETSAQWRAQGFDLDFNELVFLGERADVTAYLTNYGWSTTAINTNDLLVKCGLPPVGGDGDREGASHYPVILYISAER